MSMDIYLWSVTELRSVEDLKSIECKSGIPFSCNLNGYLSLASGNVKDKEKLQRKVKNINGQYIFPQNVLEMETFINQIQLQARFSPNSEFLYISVKSQTSEEISFQDFV